MEHLEVVIFDEIDDYSEKIKGLTFRQWIFVAIAVLVVVPTYILIPKYTPLTKDIVSYIVIIEAAIIGFMGFVKIQNLNAEQIMPFWYRHFIVYKKPIEYMTDKEWEKAHDKNNKKANKSDDKEKIVLGAEGTDEPIKHQKKESNSKLTKKQLKQQKKQEKMLKKAKAKYGYIFDDKTEDNAVEETENIPVQEPVCDDEIILTKAPVEQLKNIDKKQRVEDKKELNNVESNKIDDVFNSLSPEERKDLLKKLVNNE